MKNNKYWADRAKERMMFYHNNSDETIQTITNAYSKALHDIESDIRKTIGAYARSGELTSSQARRYLNEKIPNFILNIVKRLYPRVKNKNLKKWMLSKINAPAYKARITRLEALKQSIYLNIKQVADIETRLSKSQYIDTINQAYYRNIFDIHKGIGMGFEFAKIPTKTIEEILKNPWSGKHFSKRIWDNTDILTEQLTEILTSGFMSGKSIDRMARELSEQVNVGKYIATRLIRTETTYMANMAEVESYKEVGIEKYIYVATLDSRTSDICQELDRKVFNVRDATPGENLPPLHPNCRSTTRSYISKEELAKIKRRARNPETGKTYLVSGDMSYKEWYQKYVKGV